VLLVFCCGLLYGLILEKTNIVLDTFIFFEVGEYYLWIKLYLFD